MQVHFIAIGGSAMHNLALALHQKGEQVSGSDDAIFEPSKSRLQKAGLLPEKSGWFPEKITGNTEAVILGMHAHKDNPELLKAQEIGVKIYSYPEFLYEQSKDKTRVVIGGSHGKTTITAMVLHVLHYHKRAVDFMVAAQLDGFDTMVHLTKENDFIVLEGDEYLSSPLDKRPKFHWYKPNIALLSGIAWDHINVFPTFKDYVQQFKVFLETMAPESVLVYNKEDQVLKSLVQQAEIPVEKQGYTLPQYTIKEGKTFLQTSVGNYSLEVFGEHNLQNMQGARWICRYMGISEADFYAAIQHFRGAAKRLEKVAENSETIVFKDYAHSPSKVKATTKAVKQQYPDKKLLACFELHTYSSLNTDFIKHYHEALASADEAMVFYSPEAVKIKRLERLRPEQIETAFQHPNLKVYTDAETFQNALKSLDFTATVLLLMSSGNYGGLDFDAISQWI